MNLHGIVSGAIGSVNPFVSATIQVSTGYTTTADFRQVPSYDTHAASVQVQALTFEDLKKLDGLNIQGIRRALYIAGAWNGVIRADARGGDLITMPDGTVWLAVLELEAWPDWTKIAVTRQMNGT